MDTNTNRNDEMTAYLLGMPDKGDATKTQHEYGCIFRAEWFRPNGRTCVYCVGLRALSASAKAKARA